MLLQRPRGGEGVRVRLCHFGDSKVAARIILEEGMENAGMEGWPHF